MEQLAKDTEDLKKAEKERTEKLDNAITELETVMSDLKASNRRREEDAQRVRDEVQALKDNLPKAIENQKAVTDSRLKEANAELVSLKTLVAQRMTAPAVQTYGQATTPGSSSPLPIPPFMRSSTGGNVAATPSSSASLINGENTANNIAPPTPAPTVPASQASKPTSSFSRTSIHGLGTSMNKASIPAWQMAMNKQNDTSSTVAKPDEPTAGSSSS